MKLIGDREVLTEPFDLSPSTLLQGYNRTKHNRQFQVLTVCDGFNQMTKRLIDLESKIIEKWTQYTYRGVAIGGCGVSHTPPRQLYKNSIFGRFNEHTPTPHPQSKWFRDAPVYIQGIQVPAYAYQRIICIGKSRLLELQNELKQNLYGLSTCMFCSIMPLDLFSTSLITHQQLKHWGP